MTIKQTRLMIVLASVIILLAAGCPFKTISPTERGVIMTFGKLNTDRMLYDGLHFKVPFAQKIRIFDLTPTTVRVAIPVGEEGALSADRQTLGIGGSFDWRFNEDDIIDVASRFSSERSLETQLRNIIMSAIRYTVGMYDIANIVRDQNEIANKARELAETNLSRAGIPITITALNLNNWDWSEDYDAMIRETVATQQAVLREAAELDRARNTTQRQIIEAEARARAVEAEAQGRLRAAELDRQATIAQAQGEAEANRLLSLNLNTNVRLRELEINLERAKRWNGKEVPDYVPLNPQGAIVTLPGR